MANALRTNNNISNLPTAYSHAKINHRKRFLNDRCDSGKRTYNNITNFSVPANYHIVQALGKGSYGIVCSARDLKGTTPYQVAIKKIINIFHKEILLKRAIRELKFMHFFKGHRNIVSLIDLEIVTEKPYDGLYCYQELIEYDLAKVIHSSNVVFSEFHIKYFVYQILCGIKYIHSADVIHRDLKPGNILCTLNGCLKICDFGLARGIHAEYFAAGHSSFQNITNYVATRWYRAPELILSNKMYTKAIDMWSIGCILAEFYLRKPIFMGRDSLHQIHEIMKILGTPPKDVLIAYGSLKSINMLNTPGPGAPAKPWGSIFPQASAEAHDLLGHLLTWKVSPRFTVEQCLEHPFVMDVRQPTEEPACPLGPFDFSYENNLRSMRDLREYLIDEVVKFRQETGRS
ncbi:mitogen-activated protein kinase SMK1 KNAG_0H00790 [Huiozyma naganishii CBS 8797]|uniref:Protein kinase domain-containing protein n=1 Tax=Huiozyma naganishii (strain ATCC MYA-139 / BCRC 22969 / CBS 8797 / KCTC 17520 / NBRC 10181 / NCYC 3082 / Yp74L-3) TaxID=1071383 RepID=J7S8F1_HUIN7|nr:hypothetical protein KNAG_0H00790 [Kazachstania naganishii CBS 8797]CCK71494.1 hypothetical protein KNAG_0H00790 [Kazachstania naganishii CBS 8797]